MNRYGGRAALALGIVLACTSAAFDRVGTAAQAEDEELAASLVLTADDFPDDWTSSEYDDSPDYSSFEDIPVCRQFIVPLRAMSAIPHVSSPSFSGEASTLQNSTYIYPSARAAKRVMSTFSGRDFARCFKRSFEDGYEMALADDPSIGEGVDSVRITARTAPTPDSDKLIGYSGVFEVNRVDGTTSSRVFGYWAARAGRAITDFNYSIASDAGSEIGLDVGQLAVDRLHAAF